jgi:hypothetical protein
VISFDTLIKGRYAKIFGEFHPPRPPYCESPSIQRRRLVQQLAIRNLLANGAYSSRCGFCSTS